MSFERIIGQERAKALAEAWLTARRLPHAVLVCGPEGTGKRRFALELAKAINEAFGSFEAFEKEFTQAAVTQFGSGWAWLVVENGSLKIVKTANADLPLKHGQTALLTVDVWEHAYYIDYRNQRPKYVETFLANLVDWDFVAANYAAAV